MNGILVIDKPQNMTSHDVVSVLRRKTGIRRIGHSGTLDPMATGVLPVFIGKATRIIEFSSIPGDPEAKIYRCKMKLGIETDTQDIWGNVISGPASFAMPNDEEIVRVLKDFEGPGLQRPPLYSAVKVEGRKLYEYARKGLSPEAGKIKEREVYIKQINVNHIAKEAFEIDFDVTCSKGLYVRTLCADAGKKLGCGAVLSGLIRLKSDGFCIDEAIKLEQLDELEISEANLISIDKPLEWMARTDLPPDTADRFSKGQNVEFSTPDECHLLRVYNAGLFLGIGKIIENGQLKPEKIFI